MNVLQLSKSRPCYLQLFFFSSCLQGFLRLCISDLVYDNLLEVIEEVIEDAMAKACIAQHFELLNSQYCRLRLTLYGFLICTGSKSVRRINKAGRYLRPLLKVVDSISFPNNALHMIFNLGCIDND